MSLKLLQPGYMPMGQFDGYDTEVTLLKGGEVVTFKSVTVAFADKVAAYLDGYSNDSGVEKRTVVSNNLPSTARVLMLADEGVAGYGTMLGSLVGETAGQSALGTTLGPHTTAGSGKVTCWDKAGLYAVSLDACDTNTSTGLQPTNLTLKTGDKLFATAAGLLTPLSSASFAGSGVFPCATFVEFSTNGSLVNTPANLSQALNSPSGSPAAAKSFKFAVFYWQPGLV